MTSTRVRVLTFIGVLSAFTALVQWSGTPTLIDNITGGLNWSTEIIRFFKANTQGLIQLILLGIFFELVGFSRSRDQERREESLTKELLELALATSTHAALVARGLGGQFGDDAAEQIMASALKPCSVLRNLTLKISATRTVTGYRISIALAYDKDTDEFLVGVADNPLQCEALIAAGVLTEVFVVPQVDDGVPTRARIRVRDRQSGSHVYYPLSFRELSDRAKSKVLAASTLRGNVKKFRIFEGYTPTRRCEHEGPVMFEVLHEAEQPRGFPHTFWMSDRVLQVKSIEVDLRGLDADEQAGAQIHLFMSALQWSEDINPDNGVWQFPVQTWLLPGQGLMVIWPAKAEATDSGR